MIHIKDKIIVLIYSFSHFVVDLCCAAFIYHFLVSEFGITTKVSLFILLYDFLAFVLQLPFGILFNNKNKNSFISMVGCFLILIAYLFNMIPILPYVLNYGRCPYCNHKINILYPIAELLTAILYSLSFVIYGFTYDSNLS